MTESVNCCRKWGYPKPTFIHLFFFHITIFRIPRFRKEKVKRRKKNCDCNFEKANGRISTKWGKVEKYCNQKPILTQKVVFIPIIINNMRVRFSFHNKIVQTWIWKGRKRHWREIEGCLSLNYYYNNNGGWNSRNEKRKKMEELWVWIFELMDCDDWVEGWWMQLRFERDGKYSDKDTLSITLHFIIFTGEKGIWIYVILKNVKRRKFVSQ